VHRQSPLLLPGCGELLPLTLPAGAQASAQGFSAPSRGRSSLIPELQGNVPSILTAGEGLVCLALLQVLFRVFAHGPVRLTLHCPVYAEEKAEVLPTIPRQYRLSLHTPSSYGVAGQDPN
jgi:hypothetical protein